MERGLTTKLFADEHVEGPLVRGLRKRRVEVLTVQEAGLTGSEDVDLLTYATDDARIMITNDKDFLAIHAQWTIAGRPHGGIIYWHQTKYGVGDAIRKIIAVLTLPAVDPVGELTYL